MKIPKWAMVAAVLFMLLAMSLLAMPAAASPDIYPCNFYGTAAVNGLPVAAGTEISAWFESVEVASTLTGDGSLADDEYSLVVYLDEVNEGEDVSFMIGAIVANETGEWQRLQFVEVNLTAESDTDPPTVDSTSPTDLKTDVPVDAVVTATFNEPINASTIVFTLDSVSGSVSYNSGTYTATFAPYDDLDYSTTYTASIQASDLAGNPMAAPFTWGFTTKADEDPPEVVSTSPGDGATGVAPGAVVRANFNEDIQEGANFGDIDLDGATGVSASIDGNILTIAHNSFTYNTAYEVTIPAGAVDDLADNPLGADYTWSFTTMREPLPEEEEEGRARIRLPAERESGPHVSVGNLRITPAEASLSQPVTISVSVYNSGDKGGSKTLNLLINGELEQSTRVGIPAHGNKAYSFTVQRATPGKYTVYIEGASGWFNVSGLEASSESEEEAGLTTGDIIAFVIIAIVLIAGIIFAFLYLRRTA